MMGESKVLVNQGDNCVANKGVPSNYFVQGNAKARAADDFDVPAGQIWRVNQITALGQWMGTTEGAVDVIVTFFDKKGTGCFRRAVLLPEQKTSSFTLNLNAPCVLFGAEISRRNGTFTLENHKYFMSISPSVKSGHDQFYWSFSKTTNGEVFRYQDRVSGNNGCQDWTPGTDCGLHAPESDLCFQVSGSTELASTPETFLSAIRNNLRGVGGQQFNRTTGGRSTGGGRWTRQKRADVSDSFLTKLSAQQEFLASTMAKASDQVTTVHGTPTWVVPVAVALCAVAAILIVVVALFALYRRNQE